MAVAVSKDCHGEKGEEEVPYLKPANKGIVHLVGKELRSVVLHAGPSPDVLVVAVVPGDLEDAGSHGPHGHADDEPRDGEEGVVDADLLGPVVAASAVANEDEDTDKQRDARGAQDDLLGPGIRIVSQAGRPFWAGSDLVALKMANEVESMERMIKLQLKLTPRRANLAIRTLVLIFYMGC